LPIPTEGILPLDCPTIDGRIQTVDIRGRKSDFRATCGNDIGPGNDGIITAVVVYSLGHCLRACAAYNGYREQAGVLDNFECNAVNFQASLDLGDKGGNCYLLWNVVDDNNFDEDLDGERVAAILVS
jgi:hypothetical protein